MQVVGLLLQQMLQFFLMILLGFIVVKAGLLKTEDSKVLSAVSIYLVMPCVIINAFQIESDEQTTKGLLLAFGAAAVIHGVLLCLSSVLRKLLHLDAVEQVSVIYSNAGNIIIPVVLSVLGQEWVLYSSAFISVQIILLWTHCRGVLNGKKSLVVKDILGNVNIIAILTGVLLFLFQIHLPQVVLDTCSSVGALLAPLGMIIIGMLAAGMNLRRIFSQPRIYRTVALRLLVCPLVILLMIGMSRAYLLMPDARTILFISFLACTAPASATITQMAQIYERDAEYAGAVNIVTTLFCLLTMPVMTELYWVMVA